MSQPSNTALRSSDECRCLVVESSPVLQRLVHAWLASFLHTQVSDGEQAVAACAQTKFDLIFVDLDATWTTRVYTGFDMAARLRSHGINADTPIVGWTGAAVQDVRCAEAGVDQTLTKPLNKPAVLAAVAEWRGRTARPIAPTLDDLTTLEFDLFVPTDLFAADLATPKSARVLVVEDCTVTQHVICSLLRDLTDFVTQAFNGAQAIEACAATHFDVIFMDMHMPLVNGLEATHHIRNTTNANVFTPIIAFTSAGTMKDYAAYGVNDMLPKPFTTASLSEIFEKWTPFSKFALDFEVAPRVSASGNAAAAAACVDDLSSSPAVPSAPTAPPTFTGTGLALSTAALWPDPAPAVHMPSPFALPAPLQYPPHFSSQFHSQYFGNNTAASPMSDSGAPFGALAPSMAFHHTQPQSYFMSTQSFQPQSCANTIQQSQPFWHVPQNPASSQAPLPRPSRKRPAATALAGRGARGAGRGGRRGPGRPPAPSLPPVVAAMGLTHTGATVSGGDEGAAAMLLASLHGNAPSAALPPVRVPPSREQIVSFAILNTSEKITSKNIAHTAKEKLRRASIVKCCDVFRTLAPHCLTADKATVLRTAVEFVAFVRARLLPEDVDMLDREFAQQLAARIASEPDAAQFAAPARLPINTRHVAAALQESAVFDAD